MAWYIRADVILVSINVSISRCRLASLSARRLTFRDRCSLATPWFCGECVSYTNATNVDTFFMPSLQASSFAPWVCYVLSSHSPLNELTASPHSWIGASIANLIRIVRGQLMDGFPAESHPSNIATFSYDRFGILAAASSLACNLTATCAITWKAWCVPSLSSPPDRCSSLRPPLQVPPSSHRCELEGCHTTNDGGAGDEPSHRIRGDLLLSLGTFPPFPRDVISTDPLKSASRLTDIPHRQ